MSRTQMRSEQIVQGGAQILVIATYASLPASPTINDYIFYTPFETMLRWDGADWVGPKITHTLFGRRNNGAFPLWLHSIDGTSAFPRNIGGSVQTLGLYMVKFGAGSMWKLFNITAKSDQLVTGDLEIHESSESLIPVYATSGRAKTTFNNLRYSDTELATSVILDSHKQLQCYLRWTAGIWDNLLVSLTVARVARSP